MRVLKSGIKVTEGPPPNKKPRAEVNSEFIKNGKDGGSGSNVAQQLDKKAGKQVMMSAPSKMMYKPPDSEGPKLMKDAQNSEGLQQHPGQL
jgi:hypothetical protein